VILGRLTIRGQGFYGRDRHDQLQWLEGCAGMSQHQLSKCAGMPVTNLRIAVLLFGRHAHSLCFRLLVDSMRAL
jgi:hypothetical protein